MIESIYIELIDFISKNTRVNAESIKDGSSLENDLNLWGDEAAEFLYNYSIRFDVDILQFEFENYFTAENDFRFLKRIDAIKRTLTVKDLKIGIATGKLNTEIIDSNIPLSSTDKLYEEIEKKRNENIYVELINFVSRFMQVNADKILETSSLIREFKLSGHWAKIFLELYSKKFNVDIRDLDFDKYFMKDSLFGYIFNKISSKNKKDLCVKDLKKGIQMGRLCSDDFE